MGLIIALVVAMALLAVGAFLFLSHRRRKQRAAAQVTAMLWPLSCVLP
jgi:hypothetical protein